MKTEKELKLALQSIHNIATNAKVLSNVGVDSSKLIKLAEEALADLFSQLESLPWADGFSKRFKTECVLVGMEWYPSDTFLTNPSAQGLVAYTVEYDGCADNGTARFGRYADIDADGNPCFNYSLDDLMKYNISCF